MLKNDNNLLPLDLAQPMRIAVVGKGAVAPVIQGSGCATTNPTFVDIPLDLIRNLAGPDAVVRYAPGYDQEGFDPGDHRAVSAAAPLEGKNLAERREALIAEAVIVAADADVVVIFVSTDVVSDGENEDRTNLGLADGHDELIHRVASVNARTVVVLANPDAVVMPWLDRVPAVVETFFAGAGMGGAVADILFGLTNPSGKLTVTFPKRLEDSPAFLTYPGELGRHVYGEGLFVGYRYYDQKAVEPLFPFGHGLSYTSFDYSNLRLDKSAIGADDDLVVQVDITNTGRRAGQEICQVYTRPMRPRLQRPPRELKGHAKLALKPGESKTATIHLHGRDLKYFDPSHGAWLLNSGELVIEVGASSRDLRLQASVIADSGTSYYARLSGDTTAAAVFEHPTAQVRFKTFFESGLNLDPAAADRLLSNCSGSFFGMYDTICWFVGDRLERSDVDGVLDAINRDSGM